MRKSLVSKVCQAGTLAIVVSLAMVSNSFAESVQESFKRELKLVEGLKVYNAQIEKQISAQGGAKKEILDSITASKSLGPQIVPLMNKMLSTLDQFVKGDLPFHRGIRLESINQLKSLMLNSEATDSDRFRNIMDIYTVETEYGNTTEAYSDTLEVNGNEIEVDMLRIGRLALYYQTKDGQVSGMWDRATNAYIQLPDSAKRDIRTAIKVAAKQIAPELMNLPLTAPEGV